jgi:response regulator of citrate/malate metabolism
VIDVVVVDDDFRVAEIHAEFVASVPGYRVLAQAHTATAALEAIGRRRPDLVLLDVYLPDASGLEVLRRLRALPGGGPDVILLTAAREMEAVRTAMRAGALQYLLKPVDFTALRARLEAYAELHALQAEAGELDQRDVDGMFGLLRTPAADGADLPPAVRSPTAQRVVAALRESQEGLMATDVAERVGVSRATAQRYLSTLVRAGVVELDLDYGATGRPRHRYRLQNATSVHTP